MSNDPDFWKKEQAEQEHAEACKLKMHSKLKFCAKLIVPKSWKVRGVYIAALLAADFWLYMPRPLTEWGIKEYERSTIWIGAVLAFSLALCSTVYSRLHKPHTEIKRTRWVIPAALLGGVFYSIFQLTQPTVDDNGVPFECKMAYADGSRGFLAQAARCKEFYRDGRAVQKVVSPL
jgi:hypothetical protein